MGCSLSAPATGGVHRESPCPNICGRLREREGGRWPTSWGYYSTLVRILQGGCGGGPGLRRPPTDGDGWFCLGLRPRSAKGLAWPAPLSHLAHPPTFLETGGHAVPPAGAAPPAPRWGDGGSVVACALLQWGDWLGGRRCPTWPTLQRFWKQGDTLYPRRGLRPLHPAGGTGVLLWRAPSFSGGTGLAGAVVPPAHPPTFLGTGGHAVPPGGGCALCTLLGGGGELPHLPLRTGGRTRCACWTGGLVVACALLQRGVGLACAVVPPAPPSDVFRNRGTPPVPPAGAQPPAPRLGERGGVGAAGRFLTFRWVRGVGRGEGGVGECRFVAWALSDPHPNLPPSTGAGTEQPPHLAGRRSRACVGASGSFLTFRWVRG